MADPTGMASFLADLVSSHTAGDNDYQDYPIHVEAGVFAIVSLETADVYLVTVEEAHFIPASNTESKP